MLNDYMPSSCLNCMEQHSVKLCQGCNMGNENREADDFSFPFPLKSEN